MEIIFNTANPIVILVYTIVISIIIYMSKKYEKPVVPVVMMIYIVLLLIIHSTTKLSDVFSTQTKYISIAFDLIFLFLSFISFLWIDEINSKKKKIKSIDDSLAWFWEEL